jgi:hypothetical protein
VKYVKYGDAERALDWLENDVVAAFGDNDRAGLIEMAAEARTIGEAYPGVRARAAKVEQKAARVAEALGADARMHVDGDELLSAVSDIVGAVTGGGFGMPPRNRERELRMQLAEQLLADLADDAAPDDAFRSSGDRPD